MKKRIVGLLLIFSLLLLTCACNMPASKFNSLKSFINECFTIINEKKDDHSIFNKYINAFNDVDNYNLYKYVEDKKLSSFLCDTLKQFYEMDPKAFRQLLSELEHDRYLNEKVKSYVTNMFNLSTSTPKEIILNSAELQSVFGGLKYYNGVALSKDFVKDFLSKHKQGLITENGKGGYYDTYQYDSYSNVISGWSLNSGRYTYRGDFAFEISDKEYLDSYYQKQHSVTKSLYYKGMFCGSLETIQFSSFEFGIDDNILFVYAEDLLIVYEINEEKQSISTVGEVLVE